MIFALLSAFMLGIYEVCKKKALVNNSVVVVLLLNTLFSTLIFMPFFFLSSAGIIDEYSTLYVPWQGFEEQKFIFIKSFLVLLSWGFAYIGLKHLPLTIVGPINATRPVLVLLGAIIVFGEKLSLMQWIGVVLAIISFYLLSLSGKKEGINFSKNKWIFFTVAASVVGAVCGLYDKYLLASPIDGGQEIKPISLLVWYNFYQLLLMSLIFTVLWISHSKELKNFVWRKEILLISVFISAAEVFYFSSFTYEGVLVSIVSLVRRSSVVVSFIAGAILFKEKNIRSKAFDLALVLISMIFLFLAKL